MLTFFAIASSKKNKFSTKPKSSYMYFFFAWIESFFQFLFLPCWSFLTCWILKTSCVSSHMYSRFPPSCLIICWLCKIGFLSKKGGYNKTNFEDIQATIIPIELTHILTIELVNWLYLNSALPSYRRFDLDRFIPAPSHGFLSMRRTCAFRSTRIPGGCWQRLFCIGN